MEINKDPVSETGDEDLPSDFFDDFNKDDFMAGLSVIDSWDGEDTVKRREARRIDTETLDGVQDLRELISEGKDSKKVKSDAPTVKFNPKFKWQKLEYDEREMGEKSTKSDPLDDFIKPGSRRDPKKTNEAIKKDKEVKVKEYLAKHLESSDDLRPPGTELDDYYNELKLKENKKTPKPQLDEEYAENTEQQMSPRRQFKIHQSPLRYSPRRKYSPHRSPRHSPRQFRRFSPGRHFKKRFSPPKRYSPRRYSPQRFRLHSPRHDSNLRHFQNPRQRAISPRQRAISPRQRAISPRHRASSPRKRGHSPRRVYSPHHRHSPMSPRKRSYEVRRSRSRSPHSNTFLYPNDPESLSYQPGPGQLYASQVQREFVGMVPGYSYPPGVAYGGNFQAPYNYGPQTIPQSNVGQLSIQNANPVPVPPLNPAPVPPLNPVPAPVMVPAPALSVVEQKTPYDALAQLVAEGKISQEDYLKLAPNKGVSGSVESKAVTGVISRCNQALTKLDKLLLPNHLIMNNRIVSSESKSLVSKFCSPLKREAVVQFNFTKSDAATLAQHNKQLVESIITTLGLEKVVTRYKKKLPKDMKDAECQTTRPFCDVCEIRESTKFNGASTSTDPEYFTSSVHTQVVEQDLISSKSVFNPSGSVAEGSPISIAHLTPAQLVSQLAARAKTLQQTPPAPQPMHQNQFGRRNPNYNRGGSSQQYHSNYNPYRYQ